MEERKWRECEEGGARSGRVEILSYYIDEVDSEIIDVDGVDATAGFSLNCVSCADDVIEDVSSVLDDVKAEIGDDYVKTFAAHDDDLKLNELKTLIKIQEQGIDIQYRCPKCRECWSCKNAPESERLSIREELEEEADMRQRFEHNSSTSDSDTTTEDDSTSNDEERNSQRQKRTGSLPLLQRQVVWTYMEETNQDGIPKSRSCEF